MLNEFYEAKWELRRARRGLTVDQRAFLLSTAREKVAEGGNHSGKTKTGCLDFLSDALGDHPSRKWTPIYPGATWKGWWATTTYQLFAEQAWNHWKELLLLPGEKLPMKPGDESWFIKGIGWHTKNPEQLAYIKLKRLDGHFAEIFIKAFSQGRGEFQSAEVDRLNLDEECPEDIYDESQPRVIRRGGVISITCTPVLGVTWLEELRSRAEAKDPDVFHVRLNTLDNPGLRKEFLAPLLKKYENRPDLYKLRLQGYPLVDEGKVYPDTLFTVPGRVVKPFAIPDDWTKFRCSDHGVHVVATLWVAVAPQRKKIVIYREYYGQDVEPSVRGNALNVLRMSAEDRWAGVPDAGGNIGHFRDAPGRHLFTAPNTMGLRTGERAYYWSGIDKATLGSGQETGQRLIDLWNNVGLCSKCGAWEGERTRCSKCGGERLTIDVSPAYDNRLEPGIEKVKELLGEQAPDGSPLLVVFDTCAHFLAERRNYGRQPLKEKRTQDEGPMRPVKRDDHALDCFRYLALYGLDWHAAPAPPMPARGTLARALLEKRKK